MKKLFLLLIFFTIPAIVFSQNNNWSTIESQYSAGPISPEFQFNYSIVINKDGSAALIYTKGGSTNEYSFRVGKSGRKKLNRALSNSKVFEVSEENMKMNSKLLGGAQRSINITMWQEPNLDQMPTIIVVPGAVNPEYENGVGNLYTTIENLVPKSVWKKAQN
ncbi:MAG: hypothetical protein M3P82_04775 [Bacteroidota bacterium]|nr:hypothetical protein [Bacteroidota bacterium]